MTAVASTATRSSLAVARGRRMASSPSTPFLLILAIALISQLVGFASANNIALKAHSRECFHESLHTDDKMVVTFQVGDREFGGAGNLDIDFWVSAYSGGGGI